MALDSAPAAATIKERPKSAREEIRAIDIPRDTIIQRIKEGGQHRINKFKVWTKTLPAREFSNFHAGGIEHLTLAHSQNEETISEKEKRVAELQLVIASASTPDTWMKTTAVGKWWQRQRVQGCGENIQALQAQIQRLSEKQGPLQKKIDAKHNRKSVHDKKIDAIAVKHTSKLKERLVTLEIAQAAIGEKAETYARQVAEFEQKVREEAANINAINAQIFTSKNITLPQRAELRSKRTEHTKAKTQAEIALMKARDSLTYCDKHMRRVAAQHMEADANYNELRNGYAHAVADATLLSPSDDARAALDAAREAEAKLNTETTPKPSGPSVDRMEGEPVADRADFAQMKPDRKNSLYNKPPLMKASRWSRFRKWLLGY